MVSKKQQSAVIADLNRLEAKASSLKATLGIYREQLDAQLAQAKKEYKLTTVEAVGDELLRMAGALTDLQKRRDTANAEALALLRKME